jgi:hypothetical protein
MLHAGLGLSRRKVDVCLLSDEGEHLDQLAVAPDVESLRSLAKTSWAYGQGPAQGPSRCGGRPGAR